MILPTMTPEEKVRQASRLELDIRFAARSWVEHNQRMLKMRKTFPYTHVIKRDFKDMGTWNILLSFKEKPNFRKGVLFASNAYQKFYVTKGAKAENIGAGVYFIGGAQTHDGVPGSGTTFSRGSRKRASTSGLAPAASRARSRLPTAASSLTPSKSPAASKVANYLD